jgi:hypothetical protein
VLALGASSAIAVAAAAGALAPWRSRYAEAQVDPAVTGTELAPEHFDPALVGADPAVAGTDPTMAAPEAVLTIPATPVVTPESSIPSPTWEPSEAGMTTSLGGSDVAVASVGESNQVDGPKRKANKIQGGKKRP